MLADDTTADIKDSLTHLVSRSDALLAAGHLRTAEVPDVALRLELTPGIDTTLLFPTRRTFTILMESVYTWIAVWHLPPDLSRPTGPGCTPRLSDRGSPGCSLTVAPPSAAVALVVAR